MNIEVEVIFKKNMLFNDGLKLKLIDLIIFEEVSNNNENNLEFHKSIIYSSYPAS